MRAWGLAGMLVLTVTGGGIAHGQATLAEIHEATNVALALSPDGRTIATDLLGRIWTLPATGGAATPATPADAATRHPRFSPDGTQLVYQRYVDDQWDVWQLSLVDGSTGPLTGPPFDETEPDFGPDGRQIVLVSDRTGQRTLWKLDLDSGGLARLGFEPGSAAFPAVSDQGVVAYVAELTDIWTLRLLTPDGITTEVYRSPYRIGAPSWRPGGGALVFSEHEPLKRSDLRLMVLSQEPLLKTLTQDEDIFAGRVAWTSPGEILYAADGRLWRRGLALSTRYPVPLFAALTVPVVPAPAQARQLIADAADTVAQASAAPQLSPNGERIVQAALGDLWLGDERSRWRRLTEDPYVDFDAVFRNDDEIVFASDRSGNVDLWRLSLPRELLTQVTQTQDKEYAPAVSPDSRAVAFLATGGLGPWAPHSLRLLSFDTPEHPRTLADGLIAPGPLEWAEDGSAVLLTATRATDAGAAGPLRFEVTPPHGPAHRSDAAKRTNPAEVDANIVWSAQTPAERYVIQVGRLFDGVGTQYRRHMDMHVEGNRIVAVVGRGMAPLPETVIDAHELTVLPGFVDLHIHPTDLAGERLGRALLYYGVTTIQDVGDDSAAAVARGQAWASGRALGPRVFRAHGGVPPDPTRDSTHIPDPIIGLAAIDLLVRQASPGRAGFVAGGPASLGAAHTVGLSTLPELSPLGRAYQDIVSVLAHSRQVFVPTLAALSDSWRRQIPPRELQTYQALFAPLEHPPLARDGTAAAAAMAATTAAVLGTGGRVGLGSDAPASPFGLGVHVEMALLSASGIPNDQVLRIATSGGALALGLDSELGALEPGKLADFIVLRGDPLERITDTLSIVAVVQGGVWFERAQLLSPDAGRAGRP